MTRLAKVLVGVLAFAGVGLVVACSGTPAGAPARCSSTGVQSCSGGATVEACVTQAPDGACMATYYKVGSQTFECSSCTDTSCAEKASAACVGGGTGTGIGTGIGTGVGTGIGTGSGTSRQGGACQVASDCPSLACGCSNGGTTGYQGCNNGSCATSCPSSNQAGGAACVVPGGCFCASGVCGFGSETCCAAPGIATTGASCNTDCDCASGDCVTGQCF